MVLELRQGGGVKMAEDCCLNLRLHCHAVTVETPYSSLFVCLI